MIEYLWWFKIERSSLMIEYLWWFKIERSSLMIEYLWWFKSREKFTDDRVPLVVQV